MNIPQYWSLLEMIELFTERFCRAYHVFRAQQEVVLQQIQVNRGRPLNDQVLSESQTSFIAELGIGPMLVELDHLDFPVGVRNKARILYGRLARPGSRTWTAENVFDAFCDLNGEISGELGKYKYFQLRVGGEKYFQADHLFGVEVFANFKSARQDIKDAGNCFAIELYTACVYHLMRVAEHGLRSVAKRLGVTIQDHGKKVPLEYGDWNKVITAIANEIKKKLDALRHTASNSKRQARLDYFSDGLDTCTAMKELYRNPASHTRTTYSSGKALDAMERVQKFMQFLARPVPR